MAKNLISSIRNRPKDTAVDPKKLVKLIYSSYQDQRPTTEYKKKNSFAPSTLGYGHGTCARYWIIAFDGTEFTQDTPAMNIASMDNGTDSHTRIQAAMEKAGLLKEKEREIRSLKPPIRGFADIILEVDGKEIVGEIKTIKDQYFIARKQEMQPSNSHLLQVLIYMEVEGVDEGFPCALMDLRCQPTEARHSKGPAEREHQKPPYRDRWVGEHRNCLVVPRRLTQGAGDDGGAANGVLAHLE
jgi:hypothetical protein